MTDTIELFVLPVIQDPSLVSVERNERIFRMSISIGSEGTASASHYQISINNPISPTAPADDCMPQVLVGHVADCARRAAYVPAAKCPFDCVRVGEVPFELNLLTSNVNYCGRTAPLTSKVAFYIFIQQI